MHLCIFVTVMNMRQYVILSPNIIGYKLEWLYFEEIKHYNFKGIHYEVKNLFYLNNISVFTQC